MLPLPRSDRARKEPSYGIAPSPSARGTSTPLRSSFSPGNPLHEKRHVDACKLTAAAHPESDAHRRTWPAAACLLAVSAGMLVDQFWPAGAARWFTGFAAALFLLLEHRRIPPGIRRVALVVGGVSVLLLPFSASPATQLMRGIGIGALMVSLISAVSLLARAALENPQIHIITQHLLATPVRTRYLWFSAAAQALGGLLGMAGMNLLLQMAGRAKVDAQDERLAMFAAIMRSFSAATLWSPMVSNLTILIALYPGITWFTVAPLMLVLSAGAIAIGTALDSWRRRGRDAAPVFPAPAASLHAALWPMVAAMGGFLGAVLLLAQWLEIAVVGAIVILVPLAALVLQATQIRGGNRLGQAAARVRADVLALPMLAGEVALFMAAGCGGTIIAAAIPAPLTAALGNLLSHSAILACLALMLVIIALGFLAVHPVLSTVLVASSLPPQVLHLPPVVHLAAILSGWAISTCSTPFSMMALMASRYSGLSIYAVTTRLNRMYGLVCLIIASIALGLASSLRMASP